MAPTQVINVHPHQLPPSFSTPNFLSHNNMYVEDLVSNSNLNLPGHHMRKGNLGFSSAHLTFSNSEKKRLERSELNHLQSSPDFKKGVLKNMKFKSSSIFNNEKTRSTESLFMQTNYGVENYMKPSLKTPEIFRRVRTEVSVLNKLDYEYKREQRCLLEFKDKISEVEEEYQEILNKQKEKEKRVKERVQKLKKRFQVVIKFHSYFTKNSPTTHHERKNASD